MEHYRKTPVDVLVRHSTSGKLKPAAILYDDGKTYPIEKVTECFTQKQQKPAVKWRCAIRSGYTEKKPICMKKTAFSLSKQK